MKGLACLALDPQLRSALVFNSSPSVLQYAASQLATMLEILSGERADIVFLSSTENEDRLWGNWRLKRDEDRNIIDWQFACLAQSSSHSHPRIILIPDLVRINILTARACVMVTGADVANLERHGQSLIWKPNLWWLAGCASAEIGEVSPHLLDRFALRLSCPQIAVSNRADDIQQWVENPVSANQQLSKQIRDSISEELQKVKQLPLPKISSDLLTQILSCFDQKNLGLRREIALARLSRSLAHLKGMSEVSIDHIKQAGNLIGLKVVIDQPSRSDFPREKPSQDNISSETKAENKPEWQPEDVQKKEQRDISDENGEISIVEEPVVLPDTNVAVDVSSISLEPYPEDTASAKGEDNSLQLPQQRYSSIRARQGSIIGTQPARDWEDIAILATVLEAAKFQKIRSPWQQSNSSFRVTPADFRRYRRAPVPQQMFVVVLDYTSLAGCDWAEAISPHLSWAYTIRASVCIVQVGSAYAKNKYRAQEIKSHKLLSPNIYNAFEEQPGIATPLAHGLDLAMRTLKSALQSGRTRVEEARLVIITDGRGNIPLAASRAGDLKKSVSREGIEDVFTVAHELKKIKKVKTFLLNPQPEQYADLPIMLGEILGATIEPISLLVDAGGVN